MTTKTRDRGKIEPWCVGMLNRELARAAGRNFLNYDGDEEGGSNPAHEVMHLHLSCSLKAANCQPFLIPTLRCEFFLQNLFHSLVEDFCSERSQHRFVHKELRSLLSMESIRWHLFIETGFLQGNVAFWKSSQTLPDYPALTRYWQLIATPWWPFSKEAEDHVVSREKDLKKNHDLTPGFLVATASRCADFSRIACRDYAIFLSGSCRLAKDPGKESTGKTSETCMFSQDGKAQHPFRESSMLMALSGQIRAACSAVLKVDEMVGHLRAEIGAKYEARRRSATHQDLVHIFGLKNVPSETLAEFDRQVVEFLSVRMMEECLRLCVDSSLRSGRSFMPLRHLATTRSDRQHGWLFVPPDEIRSGAGPREFPGLQDLEQNGVLRFVPKIMHSFACHDRVRHGGTKEPNDSERGLFIVPLATEVVKGRSSHFAQFVTTVTACTDGKTPVLHTKDVTDTVCDYRATRSEVADHHFARLRKDLICIPEVEAPRYRDAFLMSDSDRLSLADTNEDMFKKLVRLRSLLFTMGQVICGRDITERGQELAEIETRTEMQKAYSHVVGTELATLGGWSRLLSAYVVPDGAFLCEALGGRVREMIQRTDALLRIEQAIECGVLFHIGASRPNFQWNLGEIVSDAMIAALSTFTTRGFEKNSRTEYGLAVSRWWEDPRTLSHASVVWDRWFMEFLKLNLEQKGKARPDFKNLFDDWKQLSDGVPQLTIDPMLDEIHVEEVKPTGYGPRILLCAYEEALLNALKYCGRPNKTKSSSIRVAATVTKPFVVLTVENTVDRYAKHRESADRTGMTFIGKVCERVLGCTGESDVTHAVNGEGTLFMLKARCGLYA